MPKNPAYLGQNIRFLCIYGPGVGRQRWSYAGGCGILFFVSGAARAAELCGMLIGFLEGKW